MIMCCATKQHPLVATAVLDAVAVLPVEVPAGGGSVWGGLAVVGPAAMALGPAAMAGGPAGMLSVPTGGGPTSARAAARAVAMQGVVWLATALDRAWALPPAGSADPICKSLTGQPTLGFSRQICSGQVQHGKAIWCQATELEGLHCPSCLALGCTGIVTLKGPLSHSG